ncbi:MAG: hypothetical protein U0Y82_04715 [Thermoleophilia bacterium]
MGGGPGRAWSAANREAILVAGLRGCRGAAGRRLACLAVISAAAVLPVGAALVVHAVPRPGGCRRPGTASADRTR